MTDAPEPMPPEVAPAAVSLAEAWAAIPGFEGRWEASTEGRVRSIPRRRTKGGLMKLRVNKRGYLEVGLGYRKHEVHRLIALTFIGPRPTGYEVRHLDGDPTNPRADNLAYGTRSENARDRRAHGADPNVNKTHCPQGHPYIGRNVLVVPSRPRARYCRACNEARRSRPDFDPAWEVS